MATIEKKPKFLDSEYYNLSGENQNKRRISDLPNDNKIWKMILFITALGAVFVLFWWEVIQINGN
jgi:hypothetical protein